MQASSDQHGKLSSLTVKNKLSGVTSEMAFDGAFIVIGLSPNTSFLTGSGVHLDPRGFVVTGHDLMHASERPLALDSFEPSVLEMSIPGVFAAGDVRAGSTKQVVSAAGEGATAALLVRGYLKTI